MKRINYIIVLLVAVVAAVSGCVKSDKVSKPVSETQGSLDLSSLSVEVDGDEVKTDKFVILLTNAASEQVGRWEYSSRPAKVLLEEGSYTLSITSSESEPLAQWSLPHFSARRTVAIVKKEVTSVGAVPAVLDNIGVRVVYTDALVEKMSDDCNVTVRIGSGMLVYNIAEKRTGFFLAGSVCHVLTAEFSGTVAGEPVDETRIIKDVKAGQLKILTFDITTPEPPDTVEQGGADVNFTIDVTCTTVDVDGNITVEENEPAEPVTDKGNPTIVWTGHDIDSWFTLVDSATEVKINITAPNTIKTLTVDIVSDAPAFSKESLQDVGLDSHLDLSNPGDLEEMIRGLHFPVREQVVGQTSVLFDITGFMPLMTVANNHDVEFVITVEDALGHQLVKSLKLKVKLQE